MEPDEPKDQDWQAALRQAEVLRRLPPRPSAAEIADAMADLSVSRATLFRRLRRFRAEGRASALVAGKAGRRLGVDPLDPALKSIVDQNIATFYATAGETVADAAVEADRDGLSASSFETAVDPAAESLFGHVGH